MEGNCSSRVVDVQPDVMTARVNGRRTKLYLNEPSEPGGLTHLAPLGGGCAWVGMPDTEVRFSVCKGARPSDCRRACHDGDMLRWLTAGESHGPARLRCSRGCRRRCRHDR